MTDLTRQLSPEEQRVWRDCLAAVAYIREQLNNDLRPSGLDINEYEVLVILAESPDHKIRMSQLAAASHQSRSRLTHTVTRLERAGLISRTTAAEDRRGVIAELTEQGAELLTEVSPVHVASVRRVLIEPVSNKDLAALGKAMRAVLKVADSTR